MSFPEVVPDSSPEVLPTVSEHHGYGQPSSHSNPKYAVPVDRNSDVTAPNTYYDSGLIPVASIHRNKFEETGNLVSSGASGAGSRHRGMICGLRRKPFWLVLGISLAVIIVGIAGGVGGAMAAASSRKAKENNKAVSATAGDNAAAANSSSKIPTTRIPSPTQTASEGAGGGHATGSSAGTPETATGTAAGKTTDPTTKEITTATGRDTSSAVQGKTVTTGTTVVSISTTTKQPQTTKPATTTSASTPPAPTQTFLNNGTYTLSGFAFQAFSGTAYTGRASDVVRDEGFLDLPFSSNSYVWLPNGADCCVTFCSNGKTAVGWWCDERRQKDSSLAFPRIWIGCGSTAHQEHACS